MSVEGASSKAKLSTEGVDKALPKLRKPSERKADDANAVLNASAVDIEQVTAKDPGNMGFGVKKSVDVEA